MSRMHKFVAWFTAERLRYFGLWLVFQVALWAWIIAGLLLFTGCALSHEDITPADLDAGWQCPEGWVPGNAAQPGECLRIAPGSPADRKGER